MSGATQAETPAALCARIGTDDVPRAIPEALVPAVNALFSMRLPAQVAVATTVFRCAGGRVIVCTTGANLTCDKANIDRTPGAGVVAWCRENRDADGVPAVAAGHDTIYQWRCRHGTPERVRQTDEIDARGLLARNWRVLP